MNDCISPGFSYTSVVSHYVYANPQAVALLFTESTEVLLLVTNSIQRDLESGSTIQKALALTALANIGSACRISDKEEKRGDTKLLCPKMKHPPKKILQFGYYMYLGGRNAETIEI